MEVFIKTPIFENENSKVWKERMCNGWMERAYERMKWDWDWKKGE